MTYRLEWLTSYGQWRPWRAADVGLTVAADAYATRAEAERGRAQLAGYLRRDVNAVRVVEVAAAGP